MWTRLLLYVALMSWLSTTSLHSSLADMIKRTAWELPSPGRTMWAVLCCSHKQAASLINAAEEGLFAGYITVCLDTTGEEQNIKQVYDQHFCF